MCILFRGLDFIIEYEYKHLIYSLKAGDELISYGTTPSFHFGSYSSGKFRLAVWTSNGCNTNY